MTKHDMIMRLSAEKEYAAERIAGYNATILEYADCDKNDVDSIIEAAEAITFYAEKIKDFKARIREINDRIAIVSKID